MTPNPYYCRLRLGFRLSWLWGNTCVPLTTAMREVPDPWEPQTPRRQHGKKDITRKPCSHNKRPNHYNAVKKPPTSTEFQRNVLACAVRVHLLRWRRRWLQVGYACGEHQDRIQYPPQYNGLPQQKADARLPLSPKSAPAASVDGNDIIGCRGTSEGGVNTERHSSSSTLETRREVRDNCCITGVWVRGSRNRGHQNLAERQAK